MNVSELPASVEDWTTEDTAEWLRYGFDVWGSLNADPPPFYPFHARLTDHFTPEQQVAELVSRSRMFRAKTVRASRLLFEELPPDFHGLRVFSSLQRLIVDLHEPGLLEVMWRRLSSPDFLGKAEHEIRRHLLAQAVLAAEGLSASDRTYKYLTKTILRSPLFDPAWAPSALSAMLHHDPKRMAEHLDVLSPIVDGIANASLRSDIIDGCKVVVDEFLGTADATALLRGLLADAVFEVAAMSKERPVTSQIAEIFLDSITVHPSLDVEDGIENSPEDPDIIRLELHLPVEGATVAREAVQSDDFQANYNLTRKLAHQQEQAGAGSNFEREWAYA